MCVFVFVSVYGSSRKISVDIIFNWGRESRLRAPDPEALAPWMEFAYSFCGLEDPWGFDVPVTGWSGFDVFSPRGPLGRLLDCGGLSRSSSRLRGGSLGRSLGELRFVFRLVGESLAFILDLDLRNHSHSTQLSRLNNVFGPARCSLVLLPQSSPVSRRLAVTASKSWPHRWDNLVATRVGFWREDAFSSCVNPRSKDEHALTKETGVQKL